MVSRIFNRGSDLERYLGWLVSFFSFGSKNVKNFCAFANVVCQSCILEEMVIRKLERKAR